MDWRIHWNVPAGKNMLPRRRQHPKRGRYFREFSARRQRENQHADKKTRRTPDKKNKTAAAAARGAYWVYEKVVKHISCY